MTKSSKSFYESPDMTAFLARCAKAMVRRAAEGDLEALSALAATEQSFHDALTLAGAAAHNGENAYSWTEIGRELGMSRQAAQQRFGDAEKALPVQAHQAPATSPVTVNA